MELNTEKRAADELTAIWLTPASAYYAFMHGHDIAESLRTSYGVLNPAQYADLLERGIIQIVGLPHSSAALIEWVTTQHGRTLNVLTTYGAMATAPEALHVLEQTAIQRGAKALMSVAHVGWTKTVKAAGYTTERMILMKKVFTDDPSTENRIRPDHH